MQNYGERLKKARKQKGLTQTELAEKLGITQKSYQRMETGNHDLKMSTIYQLCKTLEISSDWLIGLKIEK
jgi:transcriptional regulator, cro/CI family